MNARGFGQHQTDRQEQDCSDKEGMFKDGGDRVGGTKVTCERKVRDMFVSGRQGELGLLGQGKVL